MNLKELVNSLPEELYEFILKLTYKPQNKYLLNDIKNFFQTKEIGLYLYDLFYFDEYGFDKEFAYAWFVNDIGLYLNGSVGIINKIEDQFINTLLRLYTFNTTEQIKKFCWFKLNRYPLKKEFNILWGVLTPYEREQMLLTFYTPDNILLAKESIKY